MEQTSSTVLVVDDDEAARFCYAAVLRNNGHAVIEAQDGAEAINIIRERGKEIAAVLSDVHMPNIDGLKLAELNYQDGFLPFVACTMISDAATALKFLKFGVRDYVLKPVEDEILLSTVHNAISRRKLPHLFADDETPLPGNMGNITISSRFAAVERARDWLKLKTSEVMPPSQQILFLPLVSEFLMNAYEHGSLRLTEQEKAELIASGKYHDELRRREMECKAKIEVGVSIVGDEIAVNVTDPGYGFNYKRYQKMSEEEMIERLSMPNGRGIQMAMQYFDKVSFSKGGAGVLLTKKIAKSDAAFAQGQKIREMAAQAWEEEHRQEEKVEIERNRFSAEITEDMAVAARIQTRFLLPAADAEKILAGTGYRFASLSHPAGAITGDFFYPKTSGGANAGLFFADTCGHGLPAAMLSMRILSLIDHLRHPMQHASEFLASVNEDITGLMPMGRFVAGSYYIFNKSAIIFSNGGQPHPLLIRGAELKFLELDGPPLGQGGGAPHADMTVSMRKGDRLILHTDGLMEASNAAGEMFGVERLIAFARNHPGLPLEDFLQQLFHEVVTYATADLSDDVTLIGIEKM